MSLLSNRTARPTLATWLFLGAMGATVAAVLTCTLVIDSFVRVEARQQATRYLQTNADALRDALDRGMAQHYEEVSVIAQLDQVARSGDMPAVRRTLEQVRASFPQFTWIGLTDAQGVVVASVDGLLQGANVAARPWFTGAQRAGFVGDVHSAVLLEKLLPRQSEPWRFVDIATPVHNNQGEPSGVLGVHLSWTWAAKIKLELVDQVIEQHHAEALVLGTDGTVLLGSPALQGKKLPTQGGLLVVESKTRGSGRYPGLGWNVVLRQPEAVAMAQFRTLQQRTLLAAGVLCLLLAPLLWLLARRLAAPMRELTARLDTGSTTPSEHSPLYREAELLGEALTRYAQRQAEDAARLRELNATLEARVTQRTAALAGSEQRLRTITNNLPVLIAYIDNNQRYGFCNGTYEAWFGLDPAGIVGRTVEETLGAEVYAPRKPLLERALAGERMEFEMISAPLGVKRHTHTTYLPDVADDGTVHGIYALVIDVTAMKAAEEQLMLMARTDTLTGLPNRLCFNERLNDALARSRRSGKPLALLFLDVDKFKLINDTLGHGAGDEVLRLFGQRLLSCVRETDTVARLAGDEFVVILEELHTPAEPQFIARKIIAAINRSFELQEGLWDASTSIGIAFHAEGNAQPAALLAAADRALYEAKAGGRNTFRLAAM
ncbi:MAG: diguanylate cyclase [Rhizobacter sp.]|nr:diguanylate cyclase [Rhizobacter sp.]